MYSPHELERGLSVGRKKQICKFVKQCLPAIEPPVERCPSSQLSDEPISDDQYANNLTTSRSSSITTFELPPSVIMGRSDWLQHIIAEQREKRTPSTKFQIPRYHSAEHFADIQALVAARKRSMEREISFSTMSSVTNDGTCFSGDLAPLPRLTR